MRSQFVDNDGARLHYLDSGGDDGADDGGAPIVFVPGMTCLARDYEAVLPLFGRRTVVAELRGHGRSDAPVDGYDLTMLSTDVGAVVDAVTSGPVHVVTFSRGTSAAVLWTLGHADRVRSLSIGDYVPEEKVVTDDAVRWLLDGRWRGTPVRERLDEKAAIKTFQAARERSFWEPLAELNIPLLAVRSPNAGEPVRDDDWARFGSLFPSAHLVEFTDSPHDIFRPDRTRYPRLVSEHVDRADADRS